MIKSYFMDDQEYGADDFNAVVSALATGGVLPLLADDAQLTPENMNELAGELATPGITDFDTSGYKISVTDGIYSAAPGKAIMSDGRMVENTEHYIIDVPSGTAGYIYLMYDTIKYKHDIVFSTDADMDNALLLAAIAEDGTLSDKREFSKTRLIPNAKNRSAEYVFNSDCDVYFDTGFSGWNGMYAYWPNHSDSRGGFCLFAKSEEKGVAIDTNVSASSRNFICFQFIGGVVRVFVRRGSAEYDGLKISSGYSWAYDDVHLIMF